MSIQPTQPPATGTAIEGELSIDELEQIAGGLALPGPEAFTSTFSMPGDVLVKSNIDSSYTSFLGAQGTGGNEAMGSRLTPFNMTSAFP